MCTAEFVLDSKNHLFPTMQPWFLRCKVPRSSPVEYAVVQYEASTVRACVDLRTVHSTFLRLRSLCMEINLYGSRTDRMNTDQLLVKI